MKRLSFRHCMVLACILICTSLSTWPLSASAHSSLVGRHPSSRLRAASGFQQIKQVAFTPSGGWIILYGDNNYYASKDVPTDLTDKLDEYNQDKKVINFVSFAADGGWIAVYAPNGYDSKGLPKSALDRLSKINDGGFEIQDIAFTPDNEWVVLYGNNHYAASKGVSKNVTDKLDSLIGQLRTLKQVAFTSDGGWIILYNDNRYIASGINVDMKDWLKQLNVKNWPIVRIGFLKQDTSGSATQTASQDSSSSSTSDSSSGKVTGDLSLILYGQNGVIYSQDLPQDLIDKLKDLNAGTAS